ncbi:MAG: arsenate reductase [Betaproteobacteria bacterium]|nr:arsenate reductase [Betaproteobacteria bacterium]
MKLYGIPNCTTVKRARAWLAERQISIPFHDFKKDGASAALLERWSRMIGWDALLNRKGTTWRQLPEEVRAGITGEAAAIELMMAKPSVIRRPILDEGEAIHVGFEPAVYEKLFRANTR